MVNPMVNNYAISFTRKQIEAGEPEHLISWSKRWPNFSPQELTCSCCGDLLVHYQALTMLQELRTMWRRPMTINSAYRCASWNKRVSGAENSYHLTGRAFDVALASDAEGPHTASLIFYATKAGFRGFGLYPHFLHIDVGPHRTWQQGDTRLDVKDDTSELVSVQQRR